MAAPPRAYLVSLVSRALLAVLSEAGGSARNCSCA
jgi:hypothetical protein